MTLNEDHVGYTRSRSQRNLFIKIYHILNTAADIIGMFHGPIQDISEKFNHIEFVYYYIPRLYYYVFFY